MTMAKISDEEILLEVTSHYATWTQDNDQRRTRKNGWDDVTDAYWGKLPDNWPYTSRVVDPRIRTVVLEKNARLLNSKLRGRLVPRETGDVLKARINNTILDFQWDAATHGGTMLSKWSTMDKDTRLYGDCYALVPWKTVKEGDKVKFDGNEFRPLDIRDCGRDSTANNVRDSKWFQVREWAKVEDLEAVSEANQLPKYPGIDMLKELMSKNSGGDRRDNRYLNKSLSNQGLTDRVGTDLSFPTVEVVTEYRADEWITFSPRFNLILRRIKNPYRHGRIPVVQLTYYPVTGNPYGESEVEAVLPIWRAIQATINGYLDSMNIHMNPPLKILEGTARIETIVFGAAAQWMMDRPDSVTEFQGSGEALRYFQTTYSSLVSAFNSGVGEISQGTSNIDPFNPEKTATEVKQSSRQQNTRDQKNQTALAECIEDMMFMWLSNNQQFLFEDETQQKRVFRIVGSEMFEYFKRAGLDQMELPEEGANAIAEIVHQTGGNISPEDLNLLTQAGEVPKYPVVENPNVRDPNKMKISPKMTVSEVGDEATLTVVPSDMDGTYDYVADVRSMASGSDVDMQNGRLKAFEMLKDPAVLQLLQGSGVVPNMKELLVSTLQDLGLNDAERYFTKQEAVAGAVPSQGISPTPALPVPGVPGVLPPGPQGIDPSQTNQPIGLQG